ncbi:MAG: glyoxalase, partial [Gammaproteobacteria bacterium]
PDAAEKRARAGGYEVLQASADKPHGLRECFLLDPDGYCWVPSMRLPQRDKD